MRHPIEPFRTTYGPALGGERVLLAAEQALLYARDAFRESRTVSNSNAYSYALDALVFAKRKLDEYDAQYRDRSALRRFFRPSNADFYARELGEIYRGLVGTYNADSHLEERAKSWDMLPTFPRYTFEPD